MGAERHGYGKEHHPRSAMSSAQSMRRSQSAPRLRHGADGVGGREGVPYVSERSRRLAERRRSGPTDAHARLYEEASDLEARRRQLRALEEAKEAASLTPGPSISATSRKYLELRHESSELTSQPVSERLYTDGLRQRMQRDPQPPPAPAPAAEGGQPAATATAASDVRMGAQPGQDADDRNVQIKTLEAKIKWLESDPEWHHGAQRMVQQARSFHQAVGQTPHSEIWQQADR